MEERPVFETYLTHAVPGRKNLKAVSYRQIIFNAPVTCFSRLDLYLNLSEAYQPITPAEARFKRGPLR